MLNTTLSNAAQKVMNNTAPAQFVVTAKFINSQAGSKFTYYPPFIDQILIDKDFLENIGDIIDLEMTVSPKDYALMQDQGQNLLCVLTTTYVDQGGRTMFNPAPVVKQYNVMINNPRDIRKAVPDIQLHTEPSVTMSVRLIEPAVYRLRHIKINTVFQNMTMSQVVHSVTASLGIERIHMVPLHNTFQYDHVDISSYQGIDSIYWYLQHRFGLYAKGSVAYITEGVLYVYPPFETDPVYDKTALFYQVNEGKYSGSPIFHRLENKNISIVVNSQPESYDLSIAGSENEGTGFIFTRSSRMTDGFTTIDSKDGAQFTEEPALAVTLNSSRTMVKDTNNLFHIKATDNPFPAMSRIISHQASTMQVPWMNADPFQIDPGHKVAYYYDKNQVMVKKTGIVEHARFRIAPMTRMGPKTMFGAVGVLTLRLSPNETSVI
jgi:hypothetical protein